MSRQWSDLGPINKHLQPVWFNIKSCWRKSIVIFPPIRWSSNLVKHVITHSGEKTNKCNHFDYASYEPGQLKAHLLMHNWERPYKCQHCDYATSRKSAFKSHLETHTERYKCIHKNIHKQGQIGLERSASWSLIPIHGPRGSKGRPTGSRGVKG